MRITANGQYLLTATQEPVFVSGVMGAATAKLVYKDESDNFIDLIEGALAVGEQYTLTSGDKPVYVDVAGADGSTSLLVSVG